MTSYFLRFFDFLKVLPKFSLCTRNIKTSLLPLCGPGCLLNFSKNSVRIKLIWRLSPFLPRFGIANNFNFCSKSNLTKIFQFARYQNYRVKKFLRQTCQKLMKRHLYIVGTQTQQKVPKVCQLAYFLNHSFFISKLKVKILKRGRLRFFQT